MGSRRGFTLIELLIALGILSVLTLGVVQSIRRAFDNKKRIEMLNDHQSVLRDAMDVMVRDIKMAFHYRDINQEIDKAVQKQLDKIKKERAKAKAASGDGTQPATTPQSDPEEELKDTSTHFMGGSEEIHFVSLNLPRIRRNQKTADYAEVGYFLADCKSRADLKRDTQCLTRRVSAIVDDDVTKGGRNIPLLEDVTSLEFKYYGLGKLDWASDWKTFETNDAVTKARFPELVQVTLSVEFPLPKSDKTKTYTRTRVIPILFPNNPPEDEMHEDDEDYEDEEDFEDGLAGEDLDGGGDLGGGGLGGNN